MSTDFADRIRSGLTADGLVWPPVFKGRMASLLALHHELDQSQWWSPAQIKEMQGAQATALLEHARAHTRFYRDRLPPTAPRPGDDAWLALPLVTRADCLRDFEGLKSDATPARHGPTFTVETSGSTGQPVRVVRTDVTGLLWDALRRREHDWTGRDHRLDRAVVRWLGEGPPEGMQIQGWGRGFDELWPCGRTSMLDIVHADIATQIAWLDKVKPHYLVTYPSNLAALLDVWAKDGKGAFDIRQVTAMGETVPPDLAARCEAVLGARLVSNYSSSEVGYIAIQCPDCGQMHTQDETLYVEVLDDAGRPCPPGEIGRVVLTPLHNFAMPLIRYETRDYAEVGTPCPAGRGLGSLARVLGRRRNMFTLPNGSKRWPTSNNDRFNQIAVIHQYQVVQHAPDRIEARFHVGAPLTQSQHAALIDVLSETLGADVRYTITALDTPLSRNVNGKFEEFVSLVV
jgi:phenylacetate-CoA ligase